MITKHNDTTSLKGIILKYSIFLAKTLPACLEGFLCKRSRRPGQEDADRKEKVEIRQSPLCVYFVIILMPIVFFTGVGYMCEENMVGERI